MHRLVGGINETDGAEGFHGAGGVFKVMTTKPVPVHTGARRKGGCAPPSTAWLLQFCFSVLASRFPFSWILDRINGSRSSWCLLILTLALPDQIISVASITSILTDPVSSFSQQFSFPKINSGQREEPSRKKKIAPIRLWVGQNVQTEVVGRH